MEQVLIVYWSGTGNTAAMAEMVAEGIKEAGREAVILPAEEASVADVEKYRAIAMGCPSMGDEVLEESTMEPFVEEIEGSVSGKTLGLFGSYGWGDGQWMRDWTDRMKQAGASVIGGEDAICNGAPDADAEAALKELGKRLAAI
ncbi:flavodoxin [Clostridium sp. AM29-11AC]|uniref:flavodoxin n=1 Tax=Clostridium sp. AM29-11AC TaxID=2293028 RepID=UPI000E47B5C5|nr:flavodoxin [Clostridium sp. AM29-11AC]RHT58972.1 flavodoxin [Clostridium sp. AM29-11AC]